MSAATFAPSGAALDAPPEPAAGPGAAPAHACAGTRRRRLWELPPQAHELLLGTTFAPEDLRREVARTLGQVHRARCRVAGRDTDLLYGVLQDMTRRNALSEALHRSLDERHALLVRRFAPLRGEGALLCAWHELRDGDSVPAALWALLTHPQGPALETEAMYDARAWVFAQVRQANARHRTALALQRRAQAAEQALEAARLRGAQQRQEAEAERRRLCEQLAAAVGEAARWRQRAEASAPAGAASTALASGACLSPRQRPAPPSAPTDAGAGARAAPAVAEASAAAARAMPVPPPPGGRSPSLPAALHGRQVLCVGGVRHAVARYRSRVERLGARFEHHDGGAEDGLTGLDGRLQRADLVICQAACINHEAYHRIKRHCERTGTPCLYLDRPSLARLDRALAPWRAPGAATVAPARPRSNAS